MKLSCPRPLCVGFHQERDPSWGPIVSAAASLGLLLFSAANLSDSRAGETGSGIHPEAPLQQQCRNAPSGPSRCSPPFQVCPKSQHWSRSCPSAHHPPARQQATWSSSGQGAVQILGVPRLVCWLDTHSWLVGQYRQAHTSRGCLSHAMLCAAWQCHGSSAWALPTPCSVSPSCSWLALSWDFDFNSEVAWAQGQFFLPLCFPRTEPRCCLPSRSHS